MRTGRYANGEAFDVGALRFTDARHARTHARSTSLRGRRHVPGGRAVPAVHRRLAAGRRGRADRPARDGATPCPFAARDAPLAPRRAPAARGLRRGLPDPRGGLALLDRDRFDVVVDDRLRAAPRPAARGRWTSTRSRGRCWPASPTFPRYFARMRPTNQAGPAAARRRRARDRRRWPTTELEAALERRGARRRRPGVRRRTRAATSRARCRSRLDRRSGRGSAGSSTPTRPVVLLVDDVGRPRRPRPPGAADRLRVDGRLRRRRAPRLGDGRVARSRPARPSTSIELAAAAVAGGPDAPVRHRRPPGVRIRGRPRPRVAPHRRR